jgi:Protein of unknown function (DUF429)
VCFPAGLHVAQSTTVQAVLGKRKVTARLPGQQDRLPCRADPTRGHAALSVFTRPGFLPDAEPALPAVARCDHAGHAARMHEEKLMRTVGVDACRGGWVAVVLDDGQVTAVCLRSGLAEIVAACHDAVAVGVDMPLGLVPRGWRQADELAAARLGAQRSRVSGCRHGQCGMPRRTRRRAPCAVA